MVTVEAARETGVRDAGVEQSMAAALRVRVGVGNGVCGRCGDGRAVRVRATKDEGGRVRGDQEVCPSKKFEQKVPRVRAYAVPVDSALGLYRYVL